ncbi:MAG: FAD-binding protein [Lachnospiraceae bacterium]
MIHDILGYEWGVDLHSFRIPGVQGEGLRMLWEAGAGKTEPTMELTYTTPGVTDIFKTNGLDYVTVHHNIKSADKWDKEVETYLSGGESETAGLSELHDDAQKHTQEFYVADSLEEISELTGIDLKNLQVTIKEYNAACTASDEIFFKKHKYMKPFSGGKYFISRHFPAGYGSLGGVKVNDKLEVLDPAGLKIASQLHSWQPSIKQEC